MPRHRVDGKANGPQVIEWWRARTGFRNVYRIDALADLMAPAPPIRHAIESRPVQSSEVIVWSPPARQCLLCDADKCWRIVRSGDHEVSWACSEHLSPALESMVWPGDDGRTVFSVTHHSEV